MNEQNTEMSYEDAWHDGEEGGKPAVNEVAQAAAQEEQRRSEEFGRAFREALISEGELRSDEERPGETVKSEGEAIEPSAERHPPAAQEPGNPTSQKA